MTDSLAATASTAYDAALEVIASVEPRIAEATRRELDDQRGSLKLIASRELRLAGRAADHGHLVQRQVRRGHRRSPLLRRLPERRHRRVARRRARPRTLRRRRTPTSSRTPASTPTWSPSGRSWPTVSRRPRSQKLGAKNVNELTEADWETLRARARQPAPARHEPGRGRSPDPRLPPEHLRQDVPPAQYGTDPVTGLLDYDAVAAKAREFKPLILVAGYSAYPRRVNFAKMREIADEVGADADGRHGPLRRSGGRQGVHRRREPDPLRVTSSRPPPTSRCAARAAAWSWPPRSTRPTSTVAARWCSAARSPT